GVHLISCFGLLTIVANTKAIRFQNDPKSVVNGYTTYFQPSAKVEFVKRMIPKKYTFAPSRGPGRKTARKMGRVYRTSRCARLPHGSEERPVPTERHSMSTRSAKPNSSKAAEDRP